MTTAGWIFMAVAWTVLSIALGVCFYLIIKKPGNVDPGPPSGRM